MIKVSGLPIFPADPKLKIAPIPSRDDAVRPVLTRSPGAAMIDIGALLTRIEALEARVTSLEGAAHRPVVVDVEPWVVAGVSRRTWYRRQKASAK